MTFDSLIQSAKELQPPPNTAAEEFEALRDTLADEHNRRMMARPDLKRLIGPDNEAMMQDNSRNFCRFMGAMFQAYEPEVLVQTVLWVFRAYRSHGFQTTYWPAHLDTFVEIARARLSSETFEALYPFFHWLIVHIPEFVVISDNQMAAPQASLPPHQPGQTE